MNKLLFATGAVFLAGRPVWKIRFADCDRGAAAVSCGDDRMEIGGAAVGARRDVEGEDVGGLVGVLTATAALRYRCI